ncbi:hypothetical protein PgNI_10706 [Pyricularia grisea]|uniref:Ribosome quality control complex subunit 2 n=1 Tax=Pyricularia grisea TaxID=148305 RepID=A0A6P8AX81_PYRGI|nr:hypothetical protein PgNI_10706 [Pyricularia grisea]TLD06932.1 hypothetical protein PgNI_10706 [Pyricularia grisea]
MKQRFSSAISQELHAQLPGLRLSNIYDLSSKILLLKFAKPDQKAQLIIDSGFRCHLTDFARTTAPAPSPFVARLRKFLKTRRLTSVSQIGTDRIIEFQFSDGQYRLFLEFFAGGNVILTDNELKILAILRNVKEGEGQEPQRIGLTYSLDNRQNHGGIPEFTKQRLRDALTKTAEKAANASGATRKGRKSGADLRRGLATIITELPPIVVDHAFRSTNFDAGAQAADILQNDDTFDALFEALEEARKILVAITSSAQITGYIIAKAKDGAASVQSEDQGSEGAVVKPFVPGSSKDLIYEDFQPFLPKQFSSDPNNIILEFEGFNKTVDEFFSSLEGQKLESRLTEREAAAKRKLDAAREEQAKRIEGLEESQLLNFRKAAAIEANVERVQEAMDAVIGLLENGMDWVDINKLVEREQKRNNPVAAIIKLPMDLANNTITLRIGEEEEDDSKDGVEEGYETDSTVSDDDDEAEAKSQPSKRELEVDIKLNLSPWSNAGEYYDQKRSAAEKREKTIQQSSLALKSATQKITRELQKGLKQEKPVIQPIRHQMWFEKYLWFISSDGYLVLGGRDAQQNEMIYRRHLSRGDVYVHADLNGAPNVVIKNNPRTPEAPIPPSTLSQAGQLTVCASNAWDGKAAMGAYWVNADQVSKAAPTGEFLPAGSFMIKGKKNELPPATLVIGFGLLFRISEESKAKHAKQHRVYDPVEIGTASVENANTNPLENNMPTQTADQDSGSDDEGAEADDDANLARANPLQSRESGDGGDSDNEYNAAVPTNTMAKLDVTEGDAGTPDSVDDNGVNLDGNGKSESVAEETEERDSNRPGSATPALSSTGTSTPQQKKGQPKRGQRGKAKKIAQKYKDQTEEDRIAAETLLGATAGRLKREAEAKAKAEEAAALEAARERRREQHRRQQKEAAEHEEARAKQMMGEDDGDISGASYDFGALETLVGNPLPGDEILEAIPICAPYAAMGKIKYKVKLQPGAQKKGKAIKEILEAWKNVSTKKGVMDEQAADTERMWPREIALIKSLKPEEAMNCVFAGKVKIMMTGGASGGGGGGGKGGKGSKKR